METRHEYTIRKAIAVCKELDNTLKDLTTSNDTHMTIQQAGLKMLRICCKFMIDNLTLLVKL